MPYKSKPCKLSKLYVSKEEESRCLTMNALVSRKAKVWDCRPANCDDPMWIEGILAEPRAGDIPFCWKKEIGIIEMKYLPLQPKTQKERTSLYLKPFGLRELQHEMMKKGRGVLVLMAEPTPKFLGLPQILTDGEKAWYRMVERLIRIPLSRSEYPYRFVILNGTRYKTFERHYFTGNRRKIFESQDNISIALSSVLKIFPKSQVLLTLQELKEGVIADKILELFEQTLS